MLKECSKKKLFQENNICKLKGKLAGRFEFNHQMNGENFYSNVIKVKRLSGNVDEIPIIVSGRMKEIDFSKDYTDVNFSLLGLVETYSYNEMEKRHLKVYVFVLTCTFQEKGEEEHNFVYLNGFICKETIYRKTTKGKKITEMIIAVNSPYRASSYIPCIAWDIDAEKAAEYEIGDYIKIRGRFQSRNYLKRYSDNLDDVEEKIAYEVSIYDLEKLR